jgi:hypothetical protein
VAKDPLHDILNKHLAKSDTESHDLGELVHEVVAEYMAYLMDQGNIPQSFLDQLELDLREEVLEMYRKQTYGHLNLKSFRDSKKPKAS